MDRTLAAADYAQFHEAVAARDYGEVRKYLRLGVPVDDTGSCRPTALACAAAAADVEMIELLLGAGADVNVVSPVLPVLGTAGDDATALHAACLGAICAEPAMQRISAIRTLLHQGADRFAVTRKGHSPLMALMYSFLTSHEPAWIDFVTEILATSFPPEQTAHGQGCGLPALLCAAASSGAPTKILESLIACGVDLHAQHDGKQAVHYAARTVSPVGLEYLVDRGANIDALDANGRTPLYYATSQRAMKSIIARGANVNQQDNQGRTGLAHHIDTQLNDGFVPAAVIALLTAGADHCIPDDAGEAPADIARRKNLSTVAAALAAHVARAAMANVIAGARSAPAAA